jgi:hypothetical protein
MRNRGNEYELKSPSALVEDAFIVVDQRHKTIVFIETIIDLYSPARPQTG